MNDVFKRLYRFDLKSILIFVSVVETKNLYAAAQDVGCSGSFASILLKKIRTTSSISLFTREGRELRPTQEAIEVACELKRCLLEIDRLNNEIESLIKRVN